MSHESIESKSEKGESGAVFSSTKRTITPGGHSLDSEFSSGFAKVDAAKSGWLYERHTD